jgi:hypothetical protein
LFLRKYILALVKSEGIIYYISKKEKKKGERRWPAVAGEPSWSRATSAGQLETQKAMKSKTQKSAGRFAQSFSKSFLLLSENYQKIMPNKIINYILTHTKN